MFKKCINKNHASSRKGTKLEGDPPQNRSVKVLNWIKCLSMFSIGFYFETLRVPVIKVQISKSILIDKTSKTCRDSSEKLPLLFFFELSPFKNVVVTWIAGFRLRRSDLNSSVIRSSNVNITQWLSSTVNRSLCLYFAPVSLARYENTLPDWKGIIWFLRLSVHRNTHIPDFFYSGV